MSAVSVPDLLALCYIDDLLSQSNPPRHHRFLFQRLLLVCGGSSERVSVHAVNSLLSIVRVLHLPDPPRPSVDEETARRILGQIVGFSCEEHVLLSKRVVEGGNRLIGALTHTLSTLPSSSSVELLIRQLTDQFVGEQKCWSLQPLLDLIPSSNPPPAFEMSSIAGVIAEGGPSILVSEESFRSSLVRAGLADPSNVNPGTVASAMIAMLRLPTTAPAALASFDRPGTLSADSGWHGKVFARVIMEICPILPWGEVVLRLDAPGFEVRNRETLVLLTVILNMGFTGKPWPVQMLYREWRTNRQGQISWIHNIVQNPDVFCFADHPHKPVNTSMLKVHPEENNKDIANWRCLELSEILLKLCERLLPNNGQVVKCFHTPMTVCPDILLLAIFQIPPPVTAARINLMQVVIQMLLGNHSNATAVLNYAWSNDQLQKDTMHNLILNAFHNFYMKNQDDQTKLTKILEIAHELKPNGLTELFKLPHFTFTIDLACLASKRDYLKLEKFLDDKQRENGEPFVVAVLEHIRRKLPLTPGSVPSSMSQEVFSTLHSFATKCAGYSKSLATELASLNQQLQRMQMKNESVRPGGAPRLPPAPSQQSAPFMFRQSAPPPGVANPSAPPPGGVSMFGNSLAGSQELLKTSGSTTPAMSSFGSMSPSGQMMRSGMAPGRQASQTGWGGAPAANIRQGSSTPSTSIDFRPALNPGQQAVNDLGVTRSAPNIDDLTQTTFSDDIQDEANSYFEQIYSHAAGSLTVEGLLTKLKNFKNSPNQKEREVLKCVVKNLFEEYRFFHEYPERELRTTAEVYGGIIREGIISNLHFATAVRKMIESLQSDVNSMLWTFGIVSLNACRTKLCSYPKVCMMIAQHDNFAKFPQQLKDYVMHGINGQLPPPSSGRDTPTWQAPVRPAEGTAITRPPIGTSTINSRTGNTALLYTNVETLVAATEKDGAEIPQPAEPVVDKVSFLFNNLAQINMTQKRDEMREMIREHGEPFIRWLAQYIVMKRVSMEQNFQPLYNVFVIQVDNTLLDKYIKEETFRNIRILLRSDKRQAASNYCDRQLLKNLGMWLGSISIARGRPIVVSDLDLKSLLMEAYYKGQQELLFVVPFIAKILIACSKTSIFNASCAWIRSILKILAELHNEPDLKINLKFEIEVLCKELSIDLHSLPVEGVLKDTDRLLRVPQQLSDLKMLKQPEVVAGSSPIPTQMRNDNTPPVPGGDTMRSTPVADAETAAATENAQSAQAAHFHYHDINVVSYEGLVPHLKICGSLPLFQFHPQMKHIVRAAINHAIKELIGPVTDRALKVALTVTEQMIKKDFALEIDEQKMRRAAQQMMRAMTAGMASITCRDPLSNSMLGYLREAFSNSLRQSSSSNSAEQAKMIDEAALLITQENVELATNFIVKTACEKATQDLEKRLEGEVNARKQCRTEKRPFGDPVVVAQQEAMPELLRMKNTVTSQQMDIYEEFSTKICGFKPSPEELPPEVTGGRALDRATDREIDGLVSQLNMIVREVDGALKAAPQTQNVAWQAVNEIRHACFHLAQSPRDSAVLHKLILVTVEQLLYAYTNVYASSSSANVVEMEWPRRLKELFLAVCRTIVSQISLPEMARRITSAIVSSRIEHRFNVFAVEILFRQQLVQPAVYDAHLAHIVDGGSLEAAVFASKLVKFMGGQEGTRNDYVKETFPKTIHAIAKAMNLLAGGTRDATQSTIEGQNAFMGGAADVVPARAEAEESPETQSKVELILREWIALCYTPVAQKDPQQALATMIHMMHEQGVLATDDMITRFFRLCTEMCIDVSYRLLKNDPMAHTNTVVRQRCYYTLDAFVKLTCLMVKHSDGSQHQTKINLLKKVLNIVTNVLHVDHGMKLRSGEFQSMPYHRIIIIMFNELTAADTALEPIAWNILESFGQAFFILQPRRCPGFAYAWLDIIGHRNVIARLLGDSVEPVRTAAMYTQLLICHIKFLAPFLRNIELPKSMTTLYKGTLRILLVILHDFPELFCEYHYVICDAIPPNCVQLRNLILSAYPRSMRLPDPFALSFKQVDAIPEMAHEPKMCLNVSTIMTSELRMQLDVYLTSRSPVDFLSNLSTMLQLSDTPGMKYNTTVVNAVVIYVGMRAVEQLNTRGQRVSMTTIAHNAFMDIFQNLAVQLCTEGRYLLFNAIANQLRYPNVHTHYFSCCFLFLFLQADSPPIKEQITRILFERLVALRPHPWGLLITFIELINNPVYGFWQNDFTRCAPEIERLFQNVANTCVAKTAGGARLIDPSPLSS